MSTERAYSDLPGDIMLVEGNPSDLQFMTNILVKAGHRVRPASDGELALRSAQAKIPDMVLLDVKLPGMTGVEVCRRLRSMPEARNLPVLFISAPGETDLKVKALESGGTDYITKPIHPAAVLARISTHLRIHRLQQKLEVQAVELNAEIETRKELQENLCASEERLRLTLDAVSNGGWDWNITTDEVYFSDRWLRSLGYNRAEITPHISFWESVVHPDDLPRTKEVLCAYLEGYTPTYECENRLRTASGEYRENLDCGSIVDCDVTGKPLRMVGVDSDITTRKQSEQALRESEEKFMSISASAQDAIIMMDGDGNITYWNKAAEEIFGFTRREVMGRHLHSIGLIIPERFHKKHRQAWRKFQETGQGSVVGKTVELAALRKNGEEFPVEFSLSSVMHKDQWHSIGILRDISKRKQAEEKLRKLSVAVEQSPASIVITDTQGTIEYINPKFCEVTGYSTQEAMGQNPRILNSGKWPKDAYKKLWDTILSGKVWTGEFENKRKNGELYWETASICPIRGEDGTITHFLGVKQDISESKKAEESLRKTESELRKHRDHLEELVSARTAELAHINDSLVHEIEERREAEKAAAVASNAKSDFLATMSHELRTPLHGIIGMTELLLGSGLTCEQQRQAGLVKASGDMLLHIINDILDFSKIEAGKLELEITDFNLRDCIECVATLLGPQAIEKGLELTVGVNPAVSIAVRGDPGRLQQILINLVSNAIKFTKVGHIVIRAVLDSEKDSSVTIRISVTDTGIGIPADKHRFLFESFSQLDASHSRRFGGTGLGLAISKQLVEMMGGEIGAISEPDRGSTFWFSVPFEKGCVAGIESQVPDDLRQVRILAVDDNAMNCEMLDAQLTSFGIQHELASDGQSALTKLQNAAYSDTPFALVLVDLQMPDMDGLQLTERIKSDPDIENTVLLLITSAGITGDEAYMKSLGFSAYLSKPFKQSQLLDAIAQALASAQVNAKCELPQTTPSTQYQSDTQPTMAASAKILAAEDNEIGQEVIRQVLSKAGYAYDIVSNGSQAVDAWQHGDFALVLMDCQMPEMDGFEATRAIRRIEKEASSGLRIPILALTANALKGDREKCLEAGMDNHIAKPFDPAQLIEAINFQLAIVENKKMSCQKSKTNDRVSDDSGPGSPTFPKDIDDTSPPFVMDTVLKRWGGDKIFVQKLIEKFLAKAPSELDRLAEFVAGENIEEATRIAHGLKGAAAYCGAERVQGVASRLEELGRANELNSDCTYVEELRLELEHCLIYKRHMDSSVVDSADTICLQDSQSHATLDG